MEETYTLADRFFIDDGELEGVSPQTAFCLGSEFAMFRARLLATGAAFSSYVLSENVERVLRMCWNHRRLAERGGTIDGWVEIRVPGVGRRHEH